MSKFNSKTINRVTTYEGGKAYKKDNLQAWLNFLFSSFLENQYYESSKEQINRFISLTENVANEYGYTFVAKAAYFVRNELGMRSISQLTAAWLNDKTFQEKRKFYKIFMRRPDDVSEIFSAVDYLNMKRSHALVRGSADYLSTINEYQLMKYRMLGHKYNMYDIINLSHATSVAINAFKHNELESADTWETKISSIQKNNIEDKTKEWKRLVEEHKLGYMALIRNLNNILDCNISYSWIEDVLCPQIIDIKKIKASLIFPYRLYVAYKSLHTQVLPVITALEKAFRIATANVPFFEGESAVILDVSGSMEDKISSKSQVSLKEIGACFATTLAISGSKIDFIKFGTKAKRYEINSTLNVFDLINEMCKNDNLGYGTNLQSAYNYMKDNYQRIFLISDMQIFNNSYYYFGRPKNINSLWSKRYKDIITYSFDLGNYHNQIVPPSSNFIFLTSLTDVIFKYIQILDLGTQELVNFINNYVNF